MSRDDAKTRGTNICEDDHLTAAENRLYSCVLNNGPTASETHLVAVDLVFAYNRTAMHRLSEKSFKGALCLLEKAKLLTNYRQPFLGNVRLSARAITLNNLGCLMKKWGKPRVGINYLARALRIESTAPKGGDNPAGTLLNMCAALSAVGMHHEAARYASSAVEIAAHAAGHLAGEGDEVMAAAPTREDQSFPRETRRTGYLVGGGASQSVGPLHGQHHTRDIDSRMAGPDTLNSKEGVDTTPNSKQSETFVDPEEDRTAAGGLLAIAYFNLAVEQEHLGHFEAALESYQNARASADVYLGSESLVAKGIAIALERATTSVSASNAQVSAKLQHQQRVGSLPFIGKLCVGGPAFRSAQRSDPAASERLSPRHNRCVDTSRSDRDRDIEQAYKTPRQSLDIRRSMMEQEWMLQRQRSLVTPRRPSPGTRSNGVCRRIRRGVRWRALTCAKFNCTPAEARAAQHDGGRIPASLDSTSESASGGNEIEQQVRWLDSFESGDDL